MSKRLYAVFGAVMIGLVVAFGSAAIQPGYASAAVCGNYSLNGVSFRRCDSGNISCYFFVDVGVICIHARVP